MTLAVGLVYDAKARFRSRALVRVGQPLRVARWADAYEADSHEAVRAAHAAIWPDSSPTVSPSYSSWAKADLPGADRRGRGPHAARTSCPSPWRWRIRWKWRRSFRRPGRDAATGPGRQPWWRTFTTYERDLDLFGLDDAQVVAAYPRARAPPLPRVVAGARLPVRLPIAAVGVIVHVIPFQIVKQLGEAPDQRGDQGDGQALGLRVLFVRCVYVAVGAHRRPTSSDPGSG